MSSANASPETTPPIVSITLGADGRVYCHDITPDLLPVLSALCGVNAELARRQEAAESLKDVQE